MAWKLMIFVLNKFEIQKRSVRADAKPIIVSDFREKKNASSPASSIQLRLWLIYLFQHTHNFLFTTSCFISWPFTEIWWRRGGIKRWTHSNRVSWFSFAFGFASLCAHVLKHLCYLFWLFFVRCCCVLSLSRNQFRSYICFFNIFFEL